VRVVLAPDSFKGSLPAGDVAAALADGWRSVRPEDELTTLPLADGGEGTLDVIAQCQDDARWCTADVLGPDDRVVRAGWLLLADGTAVVELARGSGLPLMRELDALKAHTVGFGQLLAAAVEHPDVVRITATLGGSASTDAGAGAHSALGVGFLDAGGRRLARGGGALSQLSAIDTTGLRPPPAGGVDVLVDVAAPLFGPCGAAAEFAPQKGAAADQVDILERALRHFNDVVRGDPNEPGAGAAGGTAFGLRTLWSGRLIPGAAAIGDLVRLADHVAGADVVVTGEGRLDAQSVQGKVVGHVVQIAAETGTRVFACVGKLRGPTPAGIDSCWALERIAGSAAESMANPVRWLRYAARAMADSLKPAK
jgi:glycerate kinase